MFGGGPNWLVGALSPGPYGSYGPVNNGNYSHWNHTIIYKKYYVQ